MKRHRQHAPLHLVLEAKPQKKKKIIELTAVALRIGERR
jgi:hypothetical protein